MSHQAEPGRSFNGGQEVSTSQAAGTAPLTEKADGQAETKFGHVQAGRFSLLLPRGHKICMSLAQDLHEAIDKY